MAKISVIIAAFNMRKYMEAALESVKNQTLRDIEIVCVDDGSTDGTREVLERFAAEDARVRLLCHAENKGIALTRREGVLASSGKYIMFLDGGGHYAPEACATALNAIESADCDLVQYGASLVMEEPFSEDAICEYDEILTPKYPELYGADNCGLLEACFKDEKFYCTIWNKIYRGDIVRQAYENIPEENVDAAEDLVAACFILPGCMRYHSIKDKLCHYRIACGMSAAKAVDMTKVERTAGEYWGYRYMQQWAEQNGVGQIYGASLNAVQSRILRNMCLQLLEEKNPEDCSHAFDLLTEQCPAEILLGELAYYMHGCRMGDPAQIASNLSGSEQLRAKKTQTHTVGTYYRRLYNGGTENVLSCLAYAWKDMGYEVVVFTDEEPHPDDYPLPEGVRRVVLPTTRGNTREEFHQRVKTFRRELERNRVDLMVYHAWQNVTMVSDELCIKSLGIPLVVHAHGLFSVDFTSDNVEYMRHNLQLCKNFRLCECVVALTEVDKAWWSALGHRACRTVNPIKRSVAATPVSALDGHTVIWVGRLSEEKQPEDALEIIAVVRRQVPDVKLKIIGCGEEGSDAEKNLKEQVKKLGLEDTVSFEGFQSNVDVYYQQASVILSTSRSEGFSLVLVESKAYGIPMVTYELPNLDLVRHPRGLCSVPQRDYKQAAQRIIELLSDDELRRQMGREARASVEEIYKNGIQSYWQEIFSLAVTPMPARIPLTERTPLEAAIEIAVANLAEGMGKASQTQEALYKKQHELQLALAEHSAALKTVWSSLEYRIGLKATWLPRKLKALLRRKK